MFILYISAVKQNVKVSIFVSPLIFMLIILWPIHIQRHPPEQPSSFGVQVYFQNSRSVLSYQNCILKLC